MTEGNVVESETSETSDLDQALAIVGPMLDAGKSEDEMVVALIQAGFKFTKAARMLPRVLESKGLRMSAKDRYASVKEHLVNWSFAPANWSDVEDAISNLTEEVENTSEGQALSCIKRFAKEMEITLPEKPKGTSGGGARDNMFSRFFDWAIANKGASEDDAVKFIMDQSSNEAQGKKYAAICISALRFAQKFNS